MVVEDGQGMTAARPAGQRRIEVHLPERIGIGVLEALEGARLARPLGRIQLPVAVQDRRDGGGRRQRLEALPGQ